MKPQIIIGALFLVASVVAAVVFLAGRTGLTTPQFTLTYPANYPTYSGVAPHRLRYYLTTGSLNFRLQDKNLVITENGSTGVLTLAANSDLITTWGRSTGAGGDTLLPPSDCKYFTIMIDAPTTVGQDISSLNPVLDCKSAFDTDNLQTFYDL